jgi:hypothetical protein
MRKASAFRAIFLPAFLRKLTLSGLMIATLLLPACGAAFSREYYTPEEAYKNAAALAGREITIQGKIEIVTTACTESVCPPDNPCCNACYYQLGFRLDKSRSIGFSGRYSGCSGNSCQSSCPFLEPGDTYRITGVLHDQEGIISIEVRNWQGTD